MSGFACNSTVHKAELIAHVANFVIGVSYDACLLIANDEDVSPFSVQGM